MANKILYKIKKSTFPHASGTFIQPDMVINWNDAAWQKELYYLKEVKMRYIVMNSFIVQEQKIKRIYDGSFKNDVVDMCLRNCQESGFKVFLGIDYNTMWWKLGPRYPSFLYGQIKKSNSIIKELYEKYHEKYKDSFYGWYWVYEVDNLNFKSKNDFKILSTAVNINLDYMEDNNMRLPFMMSPFMNSKYSTSQAYAYNWRYFFSLTNFKRGDIFCPQDSVGGGGLTIKEAAGWFNALGKAAKSKSGLLFWANVETFNHNDWSSAPIKRFIKQMRLENPFVDNIITFAYSHYYSPNNINNGFHRAYKTYLYQHKIHNKSPHAPKWSKLIKSNNQTVIQWETSQNTAAYKLFCNGRKIYSPSVQRKYGGNKNQSLGQFNHKNSPDNSKYEIQSVDFWGNVSKKATIKK
ncbi:DUF4434 domain-containing protein [Clostridium tyrobutyricum]|jgi:hypothetical protein|uniref:DUF4434 domain-containing protein n=1 Tax=Clostridium tyrobutyricum TaxID=1519 RepID=UPI00073D9230|nr:DUF4434 domain-containing protein [Clostridium tyrobutyricum]MBV4427987.1 DUF4434 domain-containing protein [Clostridium tyrobutyricum]MBV4443150.1 DUF4434 domain-containing protein [Clostridium tyrobutyricum]MBV4446090.1 DUF4434 domain-containing protein [Clostridium tyrobutyricum]